jgi:nicotinate-nucleotide adenylyltransferase
MRTGVLGGTFDPPHVGHLLTAVDALEHLSLDRIVLVPNAVQPLKGPAQASAADRLAMVRLLAANDPRFQTDDIEVKRNGLSFTVDTLEELATRYPGGRAHLYLLVGADTLATFARWRQPGRVLQLATLAVLRRKGDTSWDPVALPEGALAVPTRTIEVSSSEIRERLKLGKPVSGFVNEGIERFIAERGLYRQDRG